MPTTPVARARTAIERGDWDTAWEQLDGVEAGRGDEAEVLRLRGAAAYGAGALEAAVAAFEALHALHLDRGESSLLPRLPGPWRCT